MGKSKHTKRRGQILTLLYDHRTLTGKEIKEYLVASGDAPTPESIAHELMALRGGEGKKQHIDTTYQYVTDSSGSPKKWTITKEGREFVDGILKK